MARARDAVRVRLRGHRRVSIHGGSQIVAYALIQLAAVARVFVPLAVPQWYLAAVIASGLLWSASFALFTVAFWPVLTRPPHRTT